MFEEMTVDNYDYKKSRHKCRLVVKFNKISHYSDQYGALLISGCLLVPLIFAMHSILQHQVPSQYILLFIAFFALGLCLTILGIIGIVIGQKFYVKKATSNTILNRQATYSAVTILGWRVLRNTKNHLIALTEAGFFNWGQLIIILYRRNQILICCNSRSGWVGTAPIFFITHKNRIKQFCSVFYKELAKEVIEKK